MLNLPEQFIRVDGIVCVPDLNNRMRSHAILYKNGGYYDPANRIKFDSKPFYRNYISVDLNDEKTRSVVAEYWVYVKKRVAYARYHNTPKEKES